MGRETYETERFATKAGELRSAMINVGRVRGLFDPILDALPSLGTLAVLIIGGLRLRQGAVSLPEVISVAFLFSVLAVPVRAIGFVLGELPRAAVGFRRVSGVIAATGEMAYGDVTLPPDPGPVDLTFENVSFGYPSGPMVLRDVTFSVPAGATVAIVGPTGAGKSTIASLAVRLMDPADGRVILGGAGLTDLTASSLADTIALVPQVPFVFDDTVAGNIALERDGVDGEAVTEALNVAQADRFVGALAHGVDTGVGERGTSLSGGQRQRLTLARALAGRPRLLVIDDATSAVDPRVEAAILAALRDRNRGSTASILVVAYRRATIALADVVVYVESGRVVATGTHDELLATVPGYAALVTAYETAEAKGTTAAPAADDDRELVR
jgi:ABC-type multidrug transport system fused ATPase/permease subunit